MIEWTAHPAKRRPQDIALAAFVILITAYAVLVSLQSLFLAVLAVVMLVIAILPFLAPTRYRLDAEGIEERRLFVRRARPWTELRRLEVGSRAALVSPYREPRWLDRYRAFVVYFDGLDAPSDAPSGRDAVIQMLRDRIAP